MTHTGWTKRGYLPHYDAPDAVQHVVFHLADSLPPAAMARVEIAPIAERFLAAEAALDCGLGSGRLADSPAARIVIDALLHFDGQRYRLLAWSVMPNHVHVLVEQRVNWTLSSIVHGWKSFTAHQINNVCGRTGRLWARDYFDRAMRTEAQIHSTIAYIEYNPVAAGLCGEPWDWPWSSASKDAGETPAVQD